MDSNSFVNCSGDILALLRFTEATKFFTQHSKVQLFETRFSVFSRFRSFVRDWLPLVFVFMLVHMNLPFWKSKKVADGFFSLKDSPESCFQLRLEPSNF